MIARTKSSALRHSVRNLWVSQVPEIDLSAFPALENLWCMDADDFSLLSIQTVPLRHLYCNMDGWFELTTSKPSVFSNLTHLELFGSPRKEDALAAFPCLTHLALNEPASIPQCSQILRTSKFLCALIIFTFSPNYYREEQETLSKDPRFVIMPLNKYIADWQHGALTGQDYWARADEFIAKRISGEIDRELCPNS
jgi:hypothetical protein